MQVVAVSHCHDRYVSLILKPCNNECLPEILPGQFVQVKVDDSATTFLRRPISINNVDYESNTLQLLIRIAGDGTRKLSECKPGDVINLLLPLGNSFPLNGLDGKKVLLIGGGVGVAPLLYYGLWLKKHTNADVEFLLGARSESDLLQRDDFEKAGKVHYATEDGSVGVTGFVTQHDVLAGNADVWCVCGPAPMMKAVSRKAREAGVTCYVSLENMMACGLGACLCCVEKTVRGNVCVCTEGPVFSTEDLTWE